MLYSRNHTANGCFCSSFQSSTVSPGKKKKVIPVDIDVQHSTWECSYFGMGEFHLGGKLIS